MNGLMLRSNEFDVHFVFCLTKRIIQCYVRKFSRKSLHFLEKIFHLLCVSLTYGSDYVHPMLDLLLETLKIERPLNSSRIVLHKLIELHQEFILLPTEIYSIYLNCCLIISAMPPSDGGIKPISNSPELIHEIFFIIFSNLNDLEQAPISLFILKEAVSSLLVCLRTTKDIVFSVFYSYFEQIFEIYSLNITETIMKPFFEFVTVFCSVFPAQIGEKMNLIINKLFLPLEYSISNLIPGTIEHFTTIYFLKLLLQIVKFRSPISENQTDNIINFLITFGDIFLNSPIKVFTKFIKIIKYILEDKFLYLKPEIQNYFLKILFFNCIKSPFPKILILTMETIKNLHYLYKIFEKIDIEYRYIVFSSVSIEMCKCSHTMMREKIIFFVTFLCDNVPDFLDNLLYPFIKYLPIDINEQIILTNIFSNFTTESEFRKSYVDFCDDVSYLLIGKEELLN